MLAIDPDAEIRHVRSALRLAAVKIQKPTKNAPNSGDILKGDFVDTCLIQCHPSAAEMKERGVMRKDLNSNGYLRLGDVIGLTGCCPSVARIGKGGSPTNAPPAPSNAGALACGG
ncbi:hypothetical protein CIT31_25330 [Mesorhizobium wenxiniae]|uniref:Uncharacterized protein n=1 Tax=Mesorhizobium wenxiniae TaxID=2014805 RepID=A0A271KA85_9HYPH|nr:hypothetical protein CIT31_25330 [Mesorhizobium wenxiniae]